MMRKLAILLTVMFVTSIFAISAQAGEGYCKSKEKASDCPKKQCDGEKKECSKEKKEDCPKKAECQKSESK